MKRANVWAPIALSAAVVAIVVTVTIAVGSGGGSRSGRPALLRLATDSGAATGRAEPANAGGVSPGGSPFVLDGTLPDGQPADQPVWRIAGADADAAARVGRALGLSGVPTHVDGGWVLRAPGGLRLAVREDGSWSYGLDCAAGQPVADESLDVMCASAGASGVAVAPGAPGDGSAGGGDPVDPPQPAPTPGPSADKARAAAGPILDVLGFADARVTASQGTPTSTVQASYDVDGTPTVGLTTTLSFLGDGTLATGDGWLVDVSRGDRYPVITAQRAFELLKNQPRPMVEMCMRRPDGKPGCADIPPTVITGATVGLTMAQDAGRPTLVPAWLFTVRGQGEPLAQVAVDPSYLAPPPVASDQPATVPPNGGDGLPGDPGAPETKPTVTPAGGSPA